MENSISDNIYLFTIIWKYLRPSGPHRMIILEIQVPSLAAIPDGVKRMFKVNFKVSKADGRPAQRTTKGPMEPLGGQKKDGHGMIQNRHGQILLLSNKFLCVRASRRLLGGPLEGPLVT